MVHEREFACLSGDDVDIESMNAERLQLVRAWNERGEV